MAANATAVWRVRPSGNDNNGGGFDCAISSAASGTHGSFTGTTFTDATAAAFTAGMVGSSINITDIGQYKITARIDASNITLGSGNPALTLAGPLTWNVGAGQDYSQQNNPQLSQLGTCSTATVTLTDTGASFTTALIGNAIRVAGSGITTTFTFITAVPSGTTLTLQTSPGTTGTTVTYNIGGGWATVHTNTTAAATWVQPGNEVYILGSGTPNPASYTYDYTIGAAFSAALGNATAGPVQYLNDPATPGYKAPPDTTGGMPVIKENFASNGISAAGYANFQGLYLVVGAVNGVSMITGSGTGTSISGCVFDTFGQNAQVVNTATLVLGCEAFDSTGTSASTLNLINAVNQIVGNNFHDLGTTLGVVGGTIIYVINNIIAKNRANGIRNTTGAGPYLIMNNTIDGNTLHGIEITTQSGASAGSIINNIISNQTGAGKFGVVIDTGTAATNSMVRFDYNVFYNNTANYSNIFGGPHDTLLSSTPYVGSATENYTLT